VLERVEKHNLVHPIRHGARVEIPKTEFDGLNPESYATGR
jgi:hypothetical protein